MNIMFFGAHPDDIEILCGGTAAKYVKSGHKVTYCIMTDGQICSQKISNEELATIRKQEAEAAAAIVGAEVMFLDYKDEMLFDNEQTRLRVLEAILEIRPDVIITHSEKDYALDHRVTGDLVIAVVPMAVLNNCYSKLPCLQKHPVIYMMDTVAGVDFLPTEYVDISEEMEIKIKAALCHKSQVEAFDDLHFDFAELINAQSRFRGLQAGVRFAEAFQKLNNWYSGVTKRYLP
ncbi:MAG: PIG-L family deacetylase [Planctomycetota bacterium]|nr:MAG: PIG-L family deacetylase [Planctomycetota bacterium]